ncbi:MAG: cytochrome c3 family protein [Acidobacteria bacterium]|nr:cytochrome c3 family protein [Acidobacteriota bacterium]
MRDRILTAILLVASGYAALAVAPRMNGYRLPGIHQGYAPVQPIAYSHRLHAGELQVACLYCHSAAERSRHAGIPAASICMNCHKQVTASFGAVRQEEELAEKAKRKPRPVVSPELGKLYAALGLNQTLDRDPSLPQKPISWVRVHNLPDFVYFDHRAHVAAGVACQTCHGPVETMERMRQHASLAMGWCVNCHREANRGINGKAVEASIDCGTCHF